MKTILGWKLFRKKSDGALTSLFIDRQKHLKSGVWLKAQAHLTEGYAFRPGWHALPVKNAPHLTTKGRVWKRVALKGVHVHRKPKAQGGTWYLATQMKILD